MANKKPGELMVPPGGGMFKDLILRLKLIVRLMGDRRVNFFLKLLPIASLAYLIWPIDLLMGIPGLSALDDAAIVSLGAYLFMEFCPPEVVQEHMQNLKSNMDIIEDEEDVVDGETIEADEK